MEEALVKRIMPNSLEAEQSVIGSMIMDDSRRDSHRRGFLSQAVWNSV